MIPARSLDRLYRDADGAAWELRRDVFEAALEASVRHAFSGGTPSPGEVERYVGSLHLQDLALACACSQGHDAAWEHFIREYRPGLYRAAAGMVRGDAARELADSLYAELYGVRATREGRESLFRYFHARSSLGTWLRAVLAQRHVDRVRAERRFEPLPEELPDADTRATADVECPRLLALLDAAITGCVARLPPKDRLRLQAYYVQALTLAQVGRITGEHEATVSRQLAKTRRSLRGALEAVLRDEHGLGAEAIARCFECALNDPMTLDVARLLDTAVRKNAPAERS